MGCFYNAYFFSLLFFISKTSKCYFRGTADLIPALGEQNSQAVTKFCHLQGAILFIYTVCIYFSQIWLQWTGHGSSGTIAVLGSGTVILAIYTFIVGPWLPTSSAISEGLIHKLNHLMHWLQPCLLLHSNKLQKFHLFPYSCELEHLSVCSRCAHTCQKNHSPDTCHQD